MIPASSTRERHSALYARVAPPAPCSPTFRVPIVATMKPYKLWHAQNKHLYILPLPLY